MSDAGIPIQALVFMGVVAFILLAFLFILLVMRDSSQFHYKKYCQRSHKSPEYENKTIIGGENFKTGLSQNKIITNGPEEVSAVGAAKNG
ncbi:hypothetical protein EG68_00943 [Paragonimus skrjabini miyazakii]|uniref:Uncharacterized protein n=1 Tax=Paragonimus skrjabini miyazakii TaxID=59628 RepID=A0A8S9Z8E7_9TREM|nr:hypothetical protein EG68_00943 [Paragonimus skrjabini miyazakii]